MESQGQDERFIQPNPPSVTRGVQYVVRHQQFGVPHLPPTGNQNQNQNLFMLPPGLVRGVPTSVSGGSAVIRPPQVQQPHFIRGAVPGVQHLNMARADWANARFVNVSQQAYNHFNQGNPTGVVFVNQVQVHPQGIVIQRQIPQTQRLTTQPQPNMPPRQCFIRIPHPQSQNRQFLLVQGGVQQNNGNAMPLQNIPRVRPLPPRPPPPTSMQQQQLRFQHGHVGFIARSGNDAMPLNNAPSPDVIIGPANNLPSPQHPRAEFNRGPRAPQQPNLIRPARFVVQNVEQPLMQNKPRMETTTQHPSQQRTNFPQQIQVPVGPRINGATAAARTAGPSASVQMPHVVMIRSLRHPQAQQLQFHQLPGLNFNRTQEAEPSDQPNLAENESETVASESSLRKGKSESGPTVAHSPSTNQGNVGENKTQMKKGPGCGTAGKKRKTPGGGKARPCANASGAQSNSNDASQNEIAAKRRKKKPAANSATGTDQSSNGEPCGSTGKTGAQDEELRSDANLYRSSTQGQPVTPVQRLLQQEIDTACKNGSIFQKGVRIDLDKGLCQRSGIYIFDVLVFEKDNGSDYPPVKIQITEDYPAEIPAFLDFQSIAQSISNKKIKQRFELAVSIFKKKFMHMHEQQYRFPILIFLWSMALKQMSTVPQSYFNPKPPKKKEQSTKTSNTNVNVDLSLML